LSLSMENDEENERQFISRGKKIIKEGCVSSIQKKKKTDPFKSKRRAKKRGSTQSTAKKMWGKEKHVRVFCWGKKSQINCDVAASIREKTGDGEI